MGTSWASPPVLALAALAGVAVKCALDLAVARRVRGMSFSVSDAFLIPAKDVLIAGIWLFAWISRTVVWRGNVFRIGPGSVLEPARAANSEPTPARVLE